MAHFHLPTTVSADWLEANSDLNNLVILDIRSSAEYEAGHIPWGHQRTV
jgi:rhodanese-related sulfurtransferase